MFDRVFLALIVSSLFALPATAEDFCRADVNATDVLIDRDTLGGDVAQPGLTERARGWPSRGLSRLTGRPPLCDSETLISYLAAEVSQDEIAGYCLLPDTEAGYILVPGERDYRGRCSQTTCERVNAAAKSAGAVAGTATDIATGRDANSGQSRTGAVLHASGAAILSGSAAGILSSLGSGASTAMTAALAAPAIAGAAAVSVVAIGGAVYLCR